MMPEMFPSPQLPCCVFCQRLRVAEGGGLACAAFPDGIPGPLLEGRADHRNPFPGDQGLRFEPDWGAPDEILHLVGAAV